MTKFKPTTGEALAVFLLLTPALLLLGAWITCTVWEWHAVPLGAPPITIWHALVASYWARASAPPHIGDSEGRHEYWGGIIGRFGAWALFLLFAWAVRS